MLPRFRRLIARQLPATLLASLCAIAASITASGGGDFPRWLR